MTVRAHGTDSSGRTIWASDYMWNVWERVCDELGFTPTIVQGAWMIRNGGGASASAGYHDRGGCFDLRVWNLTPDQVGETVRTLRRFGAAAWLRDQRHGMDPHIHFVLGTDHDLDSGAAFQWQQYLNGRDGLAGNGPDYHWRPSPLVTKPPEEDKMSPEDWQRMDARLDRITDALAASKRRDVALRGVVKAQTDLIEALAGKDQARITKAKNEVLAAIKGLDQ